jgi:methylisocitrate lyase
MSRNKQLRHLLAAKTVQAPGAFNALVARAIQKARFEAVYVSGAGLANAVYGLPDVGLVSMSEAVAHARAICSAVTLPVIVDGDTGFGEAINVARTVRELEAAGVSAVHFEDQVLPKKCGHLEGKALIPAEAMAEKVRAACAARQDPDFVIIARTDARGVTSFQDAVDRARCYLDAGADGIFPEAMQNVDELAEFARQVPTLLVANMTEFGKTPLLPLEELSRLGYRLVIYPQTALRVAFGAIDALFADLKRDGDQRAWIDRMQTRAELYELLDYDGLKAVDRAATSASNRAARTKPKR